MDRVGPRFCRLAAIKCPRVIVPIQRTTAAGLGPPECLPVAHGFYGVLKAGLQGFSWRRRDARANPATDRYPATVDGRHPWSAHSHSRRRAVSVMPGRVPPDDRTSSAFAAHRSLAACAASRSPCTVNDRYRERPLTWSGPTSIRTAHTPGRRCRIDPPPRASLMSATAQTTIHTRHLGSTAGLNGMRSCTKITRNG